MGHPIPYQINSILASLGLIVRDKQQTQQTDSDNCGPFTIDNLDKFMHNDDLQKVSVAELADKSVAQRLRHIHVAMLDGRYPYTGISTDDKYLNNHRVNSLFTPVIQPQDNPVFQRYFPQQNAPQD